MKESDINKQIHFMKTTYYSYYKSFETLKKVVTHWTIGDLKKVTTDTRLPTLWENLLLCIASEIALKVLIFQDTWKLQKGHNLRKLFDCLKKSTRAKLKKSIMTYWLTSKEFEDFLIERSQDFVNLRYAYELLGDCESMEKSPKSYLVFFDSLYKEVTKLVK